MAYKKSNKRKKFMKRGVNRWKLYGSAASQLYKDVKYLKSVINVERKFIDTTNSAVAVSTTPALQLINGVAQGTNGTDRIGLSTKIMSCQIDGYVTLNASATFDMVRVAIVLDRQANGGAPSYADIYESATPTSARNKLSVDRFTVLKEFRLDLDTNGNSIVKFSYFSKLPLSDQDRHVKFNGTGATISSIYSNSIYLVYIGIQATNTSALTTYNRIRFVDN